VARTGAKETSSKFQRYRASKRARGMRLLRIWAPGMRAPGFVEEAERQAKLLENKPEQIEATDFIMSSLAWPSV
jgi:Antitoxin MazE-like